MIDLDTGSESGLGRELPAGTVRVYARDASGDPKFIGEDKIEHTPAGTELRLKTGEAFDVTVQPTLVENERITDERVRYMMRYAVANARSEPVTVQIEQDGLWRNGKVIKESLKSRRIDASTLGWEVQVPANGEAEVNVTVENAW